MVSRRGALAGVVLSLLLAATRLHAQTSPQVAGRVMTGDPPTAVAGATIASGRSRVLSDRQGQFVLPVPADAAPGAALHVTISAGGFLDQTLDVVPGAAEVIVRLQRAPSVTEDVDVSGHAPLDSAPPPVLEVTPSDVRAVAGAADNIFHVLQAMPGVTATNDIDSRLSVRGGGPDQNLTVMDGVEIHDPYRLFGLASAFNPETVDNFELTAGGFGAAYGDRLSSILIVNNRAGDPARALAASTSLSITDANVVLEGRLPGESRGSWLLTGRRTYYDLIADRITGKHLPSFDDVQTKISWMPRAGQQITVFGLRSREGTNATFDGSTPGDTIGLLDGARNDLAAVTYTAPIGRAVASKTIVSWYRYGDTLDANGSLRNSAARSNAPGDSAFGRVAFAFTREASAKDVTFRQAFTVSIGRAHTLEAGLESHALDTSWGWQISGDSNPDVANGSSIQGGTGLPPLLASAAPSRRTGVWAEDAFAIGRRVHVAAGLRVDWSALAVDTPVSPRLRATIVLDSRTRLKLAGGLYTQSPGYEKLLQADYFVDLSNAAALGLKNERSWHAIAGFEHEFGGGVTARVEAYDKRFSRLLVGRLETPEETAARVAQYAFPPDLVSSVPTDPQITTIPGNSASGDAYGFDVYVQKREVRATDRLSGWIAYTWGRATIDSYGRRYPFDYDRRHAVSLVSTLRLTSRLDLGATLRLATGFPETVPVGLRVAAAQNPLLPAGAPGSLVPARDLSGLLVWTVNYGGVQNLNNGRVPFYARLDLRVTYRPSRASRWELYGEVINALKRNNGGTLAPSLKFDPTSDRPQLTLDRTEGLPLLPSFGVRWKY